MNFLAHILALAHITFWISSLPSSSAFYSPRELRCVSPSTISNHEPLQHFRFAMTSDSSISDDDNDNKSTEDDGMLSASTQDLRSFVTQRCIQSFMFLLASTRDLHTVSWLDNFTQPITINMYDWDIDEEAKPVSVYVLSMKFFSIMLKCTQRFSIKLFTFSFRELKIHSVKMIKGQ